MKCTRILNVALVLMSPIQSARLEITERTDRCRRNMRQPSADSWLTKGEYPGTRGVAQSLGSESESLVPVQSIPRDESPITPEPKQGWGQQPLEVLADLAALLSTTDGHGIVNNAHNVQNVEPDEQNGSTLAIPAHYNFRQSTVKSFHIHSGSTGQPTLILPVSSTAHSREKSLLNPRIPTRVQHAPPPSRRKSSSQSISARDQEHSAPLRITHKRLVKQTAATINPSSEQSTSSISSDEPLTVEAWFKGPLENLNCKPASSKNFKMPLSFRDHSIRAPKRVRSSRSTLGIEGGGKLFGFHLRPLFVAFYDKKWNYNDRSISKIVVRFPEEIKGGQESKQEKSFSHPWFAKALLDESLSKDKLHIDKDGIFALLVASGDGTTIRVRAFGNPPVALRVLRLIKGETLFETILSSKLEELVTCLVKKGDIVIMGESSQMGLLDDLRVKSLSKLVNGQLFLKGRFWTVMCSDVDGICECPIKESCTHYQQITDQFLESRLTMDGSSNIQEDTSPRVIFTQSSNELKIPIPIRPTLQRRYPGVISNRRQEEEQKIPAKVSNTDGLDTVKNAHNIQSIKHKKSGFQRFSPGASPIIDHGSQRNTLNVGSYSFVHPKVQNPYTNHNINDFTLKESSIISLDSNPISSQTQQPTTTKDWFGGGISMNVHFVMKPSQETKLSLSFREHSTTRITKGAQSKRGTLGIECKGNVFGFQLKPWFVAFYDGEWSHHDRGLTRDLMKFDEKIKGEQTLRQVLSNPKFTAALMDEKGSKNMCCIDKDGIFAFLVESKEGTEIRVRVIGDPPVILKVLRPIDGVYETILSGRSGELVSCLVRKNDVVVMSEPNEAMRLLKDLKAGDSSKFLLDQLSKDHFWTVSILSEGSVRILGI